MESPKKSVIIFVAHPDDEILGCGGTMAKLSQQGFEVHVVFFADGESSRNNGNNSRIPRKGNARCVLQYH